MPALSFFLCCKTYFRYFMYDKNCRTLHKQINKIIMSENKIRIDLNRHLCDSCKIFEKCEFENYELGEKQNVIRCKKYQKKNENKLKMRVEVGDLFWYYIYVDEKQPQKGFKPKSRIETENRIDNLLHEVGNYFHTEEDCLSEIKRLSN